MAMGKLKTHLRIYFRYWKTHFIHLHSKPTLSRMIPTKIFQIYEALQTAPGLQKPFCCFLTSRPNGNGGSQHLAWDLWFLHSLIRSSKWMKVPRASVWCWFDVGVDWPFLPYNLLHPYMPYLGPRHMEGTFAFWDLQISQQSWGPATDLGEENKKRTLQRQKVSKLVNEHNELSRICLKTLSLESQLCKQRDRTKRESNENKINQIWNKHGGTNMERKVRTWIQF